MRRQMTLAASAAILTLGAGQAALAEARGYVVSNWAPAMNNPDESGCPDGKNWDISKMARAALEAQGVPEAEIAKRITPEALTQGAAGVIMGARGVKDGKPASPYVYPLSVPDPKIKLDRSSEGFGFNLDGKVNTLDYTDPATKETGVDNAAARVFGCFDRTRGTREAPSGNWSFRWSHYTEGNSWLVEVSNNSDRPLNFQNDDNVTVNFYRGTQIPVMNSSGYQRNVSYTLDPDVKLKTFNSFKGKIKDGMFISDVMPQFKMIGSSRIQPVYDFKSVRMRMEFKPDGSIEGFVGGYLPIQMIYFPFGDYATGAEYYGMDVPGMYHALVQNADSDIDIDKKTGKRTRISQTYQVLGVPAFIDRSLVAGAGQKVAER